MVKLPDPPAPRALRSVAADVVEVPAGTLLWRVHARGGPHPTSWNELRHFGPVSVSRFDHHLPPTRTQPRAILYAAASVGTCLAEHFQDTRTIDPRRNAPWLVGFRLARALQLLSLRANWPTRAGSSMNINSGPRARARAWSRAIHEAYPHVTGLLYCSSMDANAEAVALYERAEPALPRAPEFNRPLTDPDLATVLDGAALSFGYALIPG